MCILHPFMSLQMQSRPTLHYRAKRKEAHFLQRHSQLTTSGRYKVAPCSTHPEKETTTRTARTAIVSNILPCPESTFPSPHNYPHQTMSPAVERTTLPREAVEADLEVDHLECERHAAELFINESAPTTASGREEEALGFGIATRVTKPDTSSYDMQRQYQDAMDVHDLTMSTSDQLLVEEQAPALPRKSALRASRLLEGLKISPEPLQFTQTHHEEYLSSEEDASSTSGDFSDFEYDSSSDDLPTPAEECSSHVTARLISVVYAGKPIVIDVPQIRRSISPSSIERPSTSGGLSDKYSPNLKSRRTSASTSISSRSSRSLHPQRALPARSISMQPPSDALKGRLDFLRVDPFANGSSYQLSPAHTEPYDRQETKWALELERPKTPKSPGTMFKGVAKAMSLLRKKSVARIEQPYPLPGVEHPLPAPTLSIPEESPEVLSKDEMARGEREPESEAAAAYSTPSRPPPRPLLQPTVTHDEIIRLAKKNEQSKHLLTPSRTFHGDESPISPISPLSKDTTNAGHSRRMSTFGGFARRRMSVKLTGGKVPAL